MHSMINAKNAPAAIGPYSHAVTVGDFIFTSGQLGINHETGELLCGIQAQAKTALQNLSTVLLAGGFSLDGVVKTTVFLTSMSDFAQMNTVYAEFFSNNKPARSCVEVAALPKGALFEIEAVAVKAVEG